MTRRAGFWLACTLVIIGCVEVAGCNGTPSNYSQVLLSATATSVGPSQTVTINATVPADKTNAGVTWVFTPGAGAPTPPGNFSSTTTTATYTSPATVTAQFTVTIQATSIAIPSETNSITITITPPKPLAVTTTSITNGVQGELYVGAQLQATGGIGPYSWALAGGSSLPANLSLASGGAITGTPQQTGTYSFTVQVTDSETPAVSATGAVTMTVTNLLNGSYAFEFSGFNSGGRVVMAGSFTTDGVSTIMGGVEDVNSISGTPKTQTFTGTYTLGNDYRGQLVLSSLPGSPTYYFSIDTTGIHGRMIEFDSTGVRGSGQFAQQSTTTCAYNTLSGSGAAGNSFVIGLTGAEGNISGSTPGPFALAGRFTAEVPANSTTPGALDNGEVDANAPGGQLITQSTLSGTFAATSQQPARCTMSVTMTLSNMNFAVYPITSSNGLLTQAYVVETDTLGAATPFVSVGRLIQQTGYPFTQTYQSFSANSVGELSGSVIPVGQNSYVPFAAIAQLADSGGGTAFTLSLVDNVAGTVRTDLGSNAISANFGTGDSYGRVDTTLVDTNPLVPLDPVFYVIGPNEALCLLGNQNAAVLGIFEPQSMGTGNTSFSAATITNVFAQGTALPSTSATPNLSGAVALLNSNATTGAVAGLQDLDVTNGQGLTESGTYALTSSGSTDGSATMTLTQPSAFNGSFFIVSPTKAVMITTTSGDTNPVLIILGDQIDDFGVN
jgi:hypothetical protein